MTKEAFEALERRIVDASGTQIIRLPGDPAHISYVRVPGAREIKRKTAAPPLRDYRAASLEHFIEAVRYFHDTLSRHTNDPALMLDTTIIFVGEQKVVAILDENFTRRERITLTHCTTRAFERLLLCEVNQSALNQADLLRLLRVDLHGCVPPALIDTVRSLRFSRTDEGHAKVEHGKESLGRNINRAVMADGAELPSAVTLEICVYDELSDERWKQAIECLIEIDVENKEFTLIPLGGELRRAKIDTDSMIAADLSASIESQTIRVLCGEAIVKE